MLGDARPIVIVPLVTISFVSYSPNYPRATPLHSTQLLKLPGRRKEKTRPLHILILLRNLNPSFLRNPLPRVASHERLVHQCLAALFDTDVRLFSSSSSSPAQCRGICSISREQEDRQRTRRNIILQPLEAVGGECIYN